METIDDRITSFLAPRHWPTTTNKTGHAQVTISPMASRHCTQTHQATIIMGNIYEADLGARLTNNQQRPQRRQNRKKGEKFLLTRVSRKKIRLNCIDSYVQKDLHL